MKPNRDNIPMGFTEETFPAGTHMCLIYTDEKERLDLIAQFLDAGIKTGEKAFYSTDAISPDEFRKWTSEVGIQVEENESREQLSIFSTKESYYPNGTFVSDDMIKKFRGVYLKSKEEGFPHIRACGEMGWATRGIPGSEHLVEYESKYNELYSEYPVTGICQYNADLFDGTTIFNILKVHPFMIVHGQIIQNPYYLSPEEFLASYNPGTN